MKRIFIIFLFLLFAAEAFAQPGTAATPPYKGRRTTNPTTCTADRGEWYYNTTADEFRYCSATNTWTSIGGGGGGITVGTTTSDGTANTLLRTNATGQVANAVGLTNTATNQLTATAQAASDVPLIVKGAASQSGNLVEVNSSAGSGGNRFRVEGDGKTYIGDYDGRRSQLVFSGASGETATILHDSLAGQFLGLWKSGGVSIADGDGFPNYTTITAAGVTTENGDQFAWADHAAFTAPDTGLARNSAGVIKATDGASAIRGFFGGGTSVASAAALPLPTGRVFHVTGTTTITSITSTNFASGAVITLIFDGVLTFTDGSNLVLAGNFVTTAGDTISLVFDGSSWHEIARSIN